MSGVEMDTGEFLAVHLPHLQPLRSWLHYLNDRIGWLKNSKNKGNAQMHAQLNGGTHMDWTKWTTCDTHEATGKPPRHSKGKL